MSITGQECIRDEQDQTRERRKKEDVEEKGRESYAKKERHKGSDEVCGGGKRGNTKRTMPRATKPS